ncbi:unnamed protein product [Heterobilharzia americana]|nr:unnamed protein product [Heterobilharzia americana]
MCIYKFSCSCGEGYIRRTTKQFNRRLAEHLPSWLGNGYIKSSRSSVLFHFVDSGHLADKNNPFKIIHHIPPSLPKGIRTRLLHMTDVGIRATNPSLCIHTLYVPLLSLSYAYCICLDFIYPFTLSLSIV